MARNTLGFFTRLFSSKKKKILEKREKEKFLNKNDIYNKQGLSGVNRNLEETKKYTHSSIEAEANNSSTVIEEVSSLIQDDMINRVHESYQTQEEVNQKYKNAIKSEVSIEVESKQDIIHAKEPESEFFKDDPSRKEDSEIYKDTLSEEEDKDDSLEYDSMVLLSKLEQLMIKLSDNPIQKSMPLVTNTLIEMANHIVEFSEQSSVPEQKKISLEVLLNRDKQNYKVLNSNYTDNKRLLIDIASVTDGDDSQDIFIDLSNDLLRIINIYLSTSVKAFKSNRISEQWKTLYAGFFVNLSKSVRQSQANQHN